MNEYNYINEFLLGMVTEAVEKMNKTNQYKELDNNISSWKDKLRSRLDDNGQVILEELFKIINTKQLFIEEELYKFGFVDGVVFSNIL